MRALLTVVITYLMHALHNNRVNALCTAFPTVVALLLAMIIIFFAARGGSALFSRKRALSTFVCNYIEYTLYTHTHAHHTTKSVVLRARARSTAAFIIVWLRADFECIYDIQRTVRTRVMVCVCACVCSARCTRFTVDGTAVSALWYTHMRVHIDFSRSRAA